jgi:subtilisin family serine protease
VEYADSAGADIINSSIGYNTFDDPSQNHIYADLDGNTTLITQAADIAASKGILVVNSAGNEGNNSWRHIIAPADGDSVLAVGAVTPVANYVNFSSVGPSADGRVKPNVAAQGTSVIVIQETGATAPASGTSFSSPLISGLAAGIWQAYPYLSNMELLQYIQRSSSNYLNPNEKVGYGIPNFKKAKELIEFNANNKLFVFPNPVSDGPIVINFGKEEIGKEIILTVHDVMGRLVFKETIASADLYYGLNADWAKGIYLLNITTPVNKYFFKVLKN